MIDKSGSRDAHAGITRPDDGPAATSVEDPAATFVDDPAATSIDDLERRFGDPWDAGNPTGHAAVLAADEAGEMLAAGEHLQSRCAASRRHRHRRSTPKGRARRGSLPLHWFAAGPGCGRSARRSGLLRARC
jgi:hypothetical protein